MPREFYTEKDIEDLCNAGSMSLQLHDQVVLTELAYEKARALGMTLVSDSPDNPPCAPIRPYLSKDRGRDAGPKNLVPAAPAPASLTGVHGAAAAAVEVDLPGRIREAVVARLGAQVDAKLLDVIIKRVLASTGVK